MIKSDKYLSHGQILVTGAAGFIGSALISYLNSLGYNNIIACDILGCDNKFLNLVPLQFNDYIEADDLIDMLSENNETINDISCIFHLGACSSTTETDCSYLISNNYEFTKALALYSLKNDIRFVYASSAATYGDGTRGMTDDESQIEKLRPLNMYGYSKHLFDLYARKNNFLSKIYGMKYFNVFGPNEYHKGSMRSMALKAFEQIVSTNKVKLFKSHKQEFSDGEQIRDFLYIKDAVKMTVHLAQIESEGGLFNIGSGEERTWIDLVTPVFEALGKEQNIEFIDMPDVLRKKYQYYTCANIEKLRSTNYKEPIMQLHDAVIDYTKNYIMNNCKHLDKDDF